MSDPEKPFPDSVPEKSMDARKSFLILAILLVPSLSVLLLAGYELAVWLFEMSRGPNAEPR